MTTKAAFSPEEWNVVLEGPPTAGLIVITAAHGGMFRETIAMSKAYVEARSQHGESELLDEIVAAKPHIDHTRHHSAEELKDTGLAHLRDAMALLASKATAEERDDYGRFVLNLANKVAAAHREGGQSVSPALRPALGWPGGCGQARRWACSSVPSSPCRQFRASATRPRTTSGGSPGVLARCHSVGSSCSPGARSGETTLGSPPASIRRHEPGAQPSRFSTIPRVLGETRWPFSSFPSVRSVTPVASAKARLSRMPSSTRRATT